MRLAKHAVDAACLLSPFPASFNGSPWLFGTALASILAISVFGLIILGWMVRDCWRDRARVKFRKPLTAYRMMVGMCGAIATLRSLPQLAFMTTACERDIHSSFVGTLLTFTRYVDVISLPSIVGWMLLLVLSYPFIVASMKYGIGRNDEFEFSSVWPRIARAGIILLLVIVIAALMAYAKATGIGR